MSSMWHKAVIFNWGSTDSMRIPLRTPSVPATGSAGDQVETKINETLGNVKVTSNIGYSGYTSLFLIYN